ncbi:hypothetical protein NQ317_008615 [Molorchus minor]|uniref:Tc1-like transposase DDE domain-containing protein n=1 Tax=Molorchus minor TaxID=1323400 RepID=A0ABQ9J070_9CUCU|nr:hypothetical protein NQ317_008615 [Molorchus minor]
MNAQRFEAWFTGILGYLPDGAVIVMDNASYHSRRCEKIPTSSTRKQDMRDWLTSKGIAYEEQMIKAELLQLIASFRQNFDNKHVVDEMAVSQNKVVLRLPPYHCELNPIELIWAQIKDEKVNSGSRGYNVTEENWSNCVRHVIEKEENRMWKLDGMIDQVVDSLIISVGGSNDSDNELDLSEDSDDESTMRYGPKNMLLFLGSASAALLIYV